MAKKFLTPIVVDVENAEGSVTLGDISTGTATTDAGVIFDNEAGTIKSAIFTEVNGEILSYGINVGQIATRDITRSGGIFRLDTRAASKEFRVIGQPSGVDFSASPGEFTRLISKLDTGLSGVNISSPSYMWDVSGSTRNYGMNVSQIPIPLIPTATSSTTGGTISAATYYFKIVALDNFGNTTPAGPESIAVTTTGSTSSIRITWAQVAGAETYRVYYGTTPNGQNTYQITSINLLTMTTTTGTAGTPPTVNTTGRVGIGSNNPAVELEVASVDTSQIRNRATVAGVDTRLVSIGLTANAGIVGTYSNHPFILYSNNAERIRITASGDIGIGTSSPAKKLHIEGDTLLSANTGAKLHLYRISDTNTAFISSAAGGEITFTAGTTSPSERMRIDSLGNVGISTTLPSEKLHVNGNIKLTGQIISDHGATKSATATVSLDNTNTAIDSFSTSSFTSAEYFVQMKQGTLMTTSRFMVVWDGTDVGIHEYGIVHATAGAANASISASESGGTVTVNATSSNAATTNVIVKTMIQYIRS
jgi:hypothetical protein